MFWYTCNRFSPDLSSYTANGFLEAAELFGKHLSDRYSKAHYTILGESSLEAGKASYLVEVYTPDGVLECKETLVISVQPLQPIGQQLKDAIELHGLTIYGASQLVGAETGEAVTTVHRRISGYIAQQPPQTLWQLVQVCKALGYELNITEILDSPLVAKHNGD